VSEFRDAFRDALNGRRIELLPESELARFMRRERVRYTGGISEEMSRAILEQTGARAVLITAVVLFDGRDPPKIGLVSRLVSTGETPRILWMDNVQMAGQERPGFFERGLIRDSSVLTAEAMRRLTDSLDDYLGNPRSKKGRFKAKDKFRPRKFYVTDPVETGTVAVMPFANASARSRAGDILSLYFTQQLVASSGVEVLEPGIVRQALLQGRLISEGGGVSLPQTDFLQSMLQVDVVLSGSVKDFADDIGAYGVPFVSFSARAIDTDRRQVIWTSVSFDRGTKGVFFFDVSRIHTAQELAFEMTRSVVKTAGFGQR